LVFDLLSEEIMQYQSEMSQRVNDIHRDLIITDQWTEPHSPWQNHDELHGVKSLNSNAQVLIGQAHQIIYDF
jgi:hypothetical protein